MWEAYEKKAGGRSHNCEHASPNVRAISRLHKMPKTWPWAVLNLPGASQLLQNRAPGPPKWSLGAVKIEPWCLRNRVWGLQNRGLEIPKSSLEPSKVSFLKDTYRKKAQGGFSNSEMSYFEPTWLHLGGPRGSQIEGKTR